MSKIIQIISGVTAGVAGFIWGDFNGLFYALLTFMVFDYLSGVIVAIHRKKLSSAVGFKGIAKKVFILMFVAIGHIIGVYVFGSGEVCRDMVIGFYIANEGISILENGAKLGLPLPKKLKAILEQLRSKNDDDDDNKEGKGENEVYKN